MTPFHRETFISYLNTYKSTKFYFSSLIFRNLVIFEIKIHPWIHEICGILLNIKLAEKAVDKTVKNWKNGKKSQICSKSATSNILNFPREKV